MSEAAARPAAAPGEADAPNACLAADALIAIGASTGGTAAIRDVLVRLPAGVPAVLVTQHMPEPFTRSFATRLDSLCRITVRQAGHGERILPGHAYIAPGHAHLAVRRSGGCWVTELLQGPRVNRHRPSVDVLFHSVAHAAGCRATGVMLSGMGKDGAAGMLSMKQAGAWNIAQDEASCVVFGMPREAIALGGVDEVLPLSEIADALLRRIDAAGSRRSSSRR